MRNAANAAGRAHAANRPPTKSDSSQQRTLHVDVEVDDAVVGDDDFSVEIEVAVEPPAHAAWRVEIDSAVVGDVDFSVGVGVPAVGEFHEDGGAVDALAVEHAAIA